VGKLVPLVTNTLLDDRLRKVDKRFDRHQILLLSVWAELEECRKVYPSQGRRELVDILRYFECEFPLDEKALRCALICLRIVSERYEANGRGPASPGRRGSAPESRA
jgi:hypothetical protein